jgi:Family of unknown function (DUF6339)
VRLNVIKEDDLDRLFDDVQDPVRLGLYRTAEVVPLDAYKVLPSPIEADDEVPKLTVTNTSGKKDRATDDAANAILLHKWLKFPTARAARDNRLWTWLSHAIFPGYIRSRWPIRETPDRATVDVRNHWILRGEGRGAIVRHGLARLWWAAECTHEPWKLFGELKGLENDDPYSLTRFLLGVQNVNLQIRDRSFAGNPVVLMGALNALENFGGSVDKGAAWLGRELNLAGRYRSLDSLGYQGVRDLSLQLLRLPGAPK